MTNTNPLLSKVKLPGETLRLPSQGILYNNEELSPDVKNGEVHLYPMTALDEIIIRSPDKLFSGDAIIEVFKNCIPQILKPKELLLKDIDFLMVALRKITYGDDYSVDYTHTCENAKRHSYQADISNFLKATKQLNPVMVSSKFTITLDNEQVVKMHPIKYGDYIEIAHAQIENTDLSIETIWKQTLMAILSIIDSVDDVSDKEQISEWLSSIPAPWAKKIAESVDSTLEWGMDFTYKITCKDCGEEIVVPVPVNPISFFI